MLDQLLCNRPYAFRALFLELRLETPEVDDSLKRRRPRHGFDLVVVHPAVIESKDEASARFCTARLDEYAVHSHAVESLEPQEATDALASEILLQCRVGGFKGAEVLLVETGPVVCDHEALDGGVWPISSVNLELGLALHADLDVPILSFSQLYGLQ